LTTWIDKHKRWAGNYRKHMFAYIKQALLMLDQLMPTFKDLTGKQRIVVYQKLFRIDACYTAARFLAALDPVDVIAIYCFDKEGKLWR
jgi:hypothetical protein